MTRPHISNSGHEQNKLPQHATPETRNQQDTQLRADPHRHPAILARHERHKEPLTTTRATRTASRYVAAPPRPAPFRSLAIIVFSPRRAVTAADPTLLTVRNAAGDPLKISLLDFFFCIFFCHSDMFTFLSACLSLCL